MNLRSRFVPPFALFAALLAPSAHAQQGTPFYDPPPSPAPMEPSSEEPEWPPASASASASAPASASASAEPWTRFGAAGSVVFSAASSLGASVTNYAAPSEASSWSVGFGPGVDWFVVRGLSLGLGVDADTGSAKGYGTTGLIEMPYTDWSANVRVGYAIALSRQWSLWPRAELWYGRSIGRTTYDDGTPDVRRGAHGFAATGYVPVVFEPASSFFIGLGPSYTVPFATTQDEAAHYTWTTGFGAGVLVGGFVGGEPDADEAQPAGSAPARRFGDEGTFAFGGDFAVSVRHSSDDDAPYSFTSFTIAPAFDYFVAEHVSLGVAPDIGHSSSSLRDASGVDQDRTSTTMGVGGRVGYDVPLGRWASLWMRAGLGFSATSSEATFGFPTSFPGAAAGETRTIDWTDKIAWTQLSAPILAHVAPHAFVGAGPYLYHELSHVAEQPALTGPEQTTVGVSLYVGGWL